MEPVEPKALTVSQLTRRIKSTLEDLPELQSVWVRGEISNLTRHSSGHIYFSLKDAGSQIRAVMFARHAATVRGPLSEGLEALALGSISVYEKRGEYQLYVTALRPAGVGALYAQFEMLKSKLAGEGLFDPARKKPIPALPGRIAVITSPTGAAVRDVINIVTRRYPALELTVVPAIVQGDDAPASIRAALRRAIALPGVDTILLVRGGGSIEDLWAFNDEALARDIAKCPIPIISGVGHETDFTIADFVSDLRAPTPSAAAERAVPELQLLKRRHSQATATLRRSLLNSLNYEKSRLRACAQSITLRRIRDILDRRREIIDDINRTIQMQLRHRLDASRQQLYAVNGRLAALDPFAVLGRGYAFLRQAKTGNIVTSVERIKEGAEFEAVLTDGEIRAVAVQLYKRKLAETIKRDGELDL